MIEINVNSSQLERAKILFDFKMKNLILISKKMKFNWGAW